jgi:iron complex transport system substrate-binding protein
MENTYAECFQVYFYKDGYKLFTIENGSKFLLVPEGKEAPSNLPEDVTVLKAPVENIYLAATAQMALFSSMNGLDSVRFTSLKKEGWTFDSIKDKMDAGDILFAGKYSEPDYEMLLEEDCNLAVESTMINHTPEIKEMLEDLDIPVMIDRSSYESNPLGRMEWIRFYGQLIGKSEEADAFFEEQKTKVAALDDFENTEKTVAFFYISSDGKAIVRSSEDYIPTMIEMAGARYIFKDLVDETGKANIPMTIEKFYDVAADADFIVYNGNIDAQVKTLDNLKDKDPIMQEFKAVKEGNCWSTGSSMYQRTDIAGDMIMDFHTLFTEDDPADKLNYLTKLE